MGLARIPIRIQPKGGPLTARIHRELEVSISFMEVFGDPLVGDLQKRSSTLSLRGIRLKILRGSWPRRRSPKGPRDHRLLECRGAIPLSDVQAWRARSVASYNLATQVDPESHCVLGSRGMGHRKSCKPVAAIESRDCRGRSGLTK